MLGVKPTNSCTCRDNDLKENKFIKSIADSTQILADVRNLTKRDSLACVPQLWDLIGLVTPATIELRINLEELWRAGYSLDEIPPEQIQTKWRKKVQTHSQHLAHEFNRKLKPDTAAGLAGIHGFFDSGEKAYESTIFVRWKLADGSYRSIPLMITALDAPLKKISVPSLELMGCLSLARLYSTYKEALEFAVITRCNSMSWMDYHTVLTWIRSYSRKFKPFVSVRVADIQEALETEAFRYVRSACNPFDLLTRGAPPEELKSWMEGPPVLWFPEEEW